jgi:3-hydroxyisobutyrate dehydrogenase-like beta-hydroxyacid dehydrogenase
MKMSEQKIGFIGLGLMGAAMVDRLMSKGHDLIVLGNTSRPRIDAAIAKGAIEAVSPKDLASKCDIIMLCMDTSASVESRMFGDDGVIAGLKPGSIVIDFGTSLPSSTKNLGDKLTEIGSFYLDGPLGRTPSHALEGKLNIMTSGDETAFNTIKPVLEDLAENVFFLGDLATGHTIKLINNFFAMTTASAMSEAFVMADKAGVDRQKVYDVMSAGPTHSMMMDFIKGFAIDGNAENLAFSIKNAAKDVGYYSQMAKDAGFSDSLVPEMVSFFEHEYKD